MLGLLNQEISTELDKFPSVRSYSFLSQKEMGELFAICDIAITRGGTTSLAEQHLYDLKQIIVPIPRTIKGNPSEVILSANFSKALAYLFIL